MLEEHPPVYGTGHEPPPYAQTPPLPVVPVADSLEALDVDNVAAGIARSEADKSKTLRSELVGLLSHIVTRRLGRSPSPSLVDAYARWKSAILRRLDGVSTTPTGQDVTHNPGFNYYHKDNWLKIKEYFTELEFRRDKDGELVEIDVNNGPIKEFEPERLVNRLKLDDVSATRSQFLQYILVEAYRGLYLHGEEKDKFETKWGRPISKKVLSSPNNLRIDHVWHRVKAVLEFIKQDVLKHHRQWKNLSAKPRIDAFREMYKVEEVIAKMSLLSGNKTAVLNRFRDIIGRHGRSNQEESSQSSLGHREHNSSAFVVQGRRL